MSFYLCKHAKLEAEPVMLAGEQYYAVAVHGKGHLVHGPAFELMYQRSLVDCGEPASVEAPVEAPLPVVEARRATAPTAKVARKSAAASKKPAALPTSAKASPMQQRVLDILANGPLTTSELATAVYVDLDRKTACMNIYPLTAAMKDKGLIEKREDQTAGGLMKWYAV